MGLSKAEIEAFYDRTASAAYGLALRITGERDTAEAACEAAYEQALQEAAGGDSVEQERAMLRCVRELSLALRRGSTRGAQDAPAEAPATVGILSQLNALTPLERRCVELAYFGGLPAQGIAELLGETADEIRRAMRLGLLRLAGASASEAAR